MGLFLHRFSSRSDLPFADTTSSLPTLGLPRISRSLVYPACSVRPTVRSSHRQCSRARHVALYFATFQRLARYFLSFPRLLSLSLSLRFSFSRYLRPLFRRNYYFFFFRSYKAALFSIFCFVHVIHFLSYPVLVLGFLKMQRLDL